MVAHFTGAQSTRSTIAAQPVPAAPEPERSAGMDLAARTASGHPEPPPPGSHDGIRAAASVMGWVLWLLLAFLTAAFLTFAPWML